VRLMSTHSTTAPISLSRPALLPSTTKTTATRLPPRTSFSSSARRPPASRRWPGWSITRNFLGTVDLARPVLSLVLGSGGGRTKRDDEGVREEWVSGRAPCVSCGISRDEARSVRVSSWRFEPIAGDRRAELGAGLALRTAAKMAVLPAPGGPTRTIVRSRT
jgi:hypothetical protein